MRNFALRGGLMSCAVMLMLGTTGPVGAQAQGPVVIQGGTLIDGLGGAPVPNSVIVIEGERIAAVGPAGSVQVPAGAQIIDASGKWVIPGLFDAKANWNWQYGEAFLRYGVTSAIVSGGRNNQGSAERDAINNGIYPGPRLYQALVTINGPGPNLDRPENYGPGGGTRRIYSGEDGVAHVRAMHEAGADIITFQNGDGPPEIFAPAVAEAQRLGMGIDFRAMGPQTRAREVCEMGDGIVYVHTGNTGTQIATDESKWATYIALPPDAYSDMDESKVDPMIEHLRGCDAYLEPDLMATARGFHRNWARVQQEARDVFQDPEMLSYYPEFSIHDLWENVQSPEEYLTAEQIAVRSAGFRNQMIFLKRYVDAGGKLVAASDITQSPPGLGVHQEFTAFVEDVGLTPMQAIQSATKWVAEGFKIDDVGSLETGNFADVLILNSDPLVDIKNTRDIAMVLKGGEVLDREYHSWYGGYIFSQIGSDDDPFVSATEWAAALKDATFRPGGGGNVNVQGAAAPPPMVPNPALNPTPGIESFTPHTVLRNSPETKVTITGFNFVQESRAYFDGVAVPTRVVSRTEIEMMVPANLLARAGRFEIVVKNREPIADIFWGDTSNSAFMLVPFEFTTLLPQPEW
jgi:imidazolonepropionase-like amidohydrolase